MRKNIERVRSVLDHSQMAVSQPALLTLALEGEPMSPVCMVEGGHERVSTLVAPSMPEAYEAVRSLLTLAAPPSPSGCGPQGTTPAPQEAMSWRLVPALGNPVIMVKHQPLSLLI